METKAKLFEESQTPFPYCNIMMDRSKELQFICKEGFLDKKWVGVDEAGAGALCGPVVAAACYVPPNIEIHPLIKDSKKMTFQNRLEVFEYLTLHDEIEFDVTFIDPVEIDDINILQARLKAMGTSIQNMNAKLALVDGDKSPFRYCDCKICTFIKGDDNIYSIACASIIAKVARDLFMLQMAEVYPEYDLAANFGYGTPNHLKALHKHKAIPFFHRYSYKIVLNNA